MQSTDVTTTRAANSFANNQRVGTYMLLSMATALVAFAVVVATSLPASQGIKLSPLDTQQAAALVTPDSSPN